MAIQIKMKNVYLNSGGGGTQFEKKVEQELGMILHSSGKASEQCYMAVSETNQILDMII